MQEKFQAQHAVLTSDWTPDCESLYTISPDHGRERLTVDVPPLHKRIRLEIFGSATCNLHAERQRETAHMQFLLKPLFPQINGNQTDVVLEILIAWRWFPEYRK